MRILTLDIETSPNLATVWGIWQQNVALNQLLDTTRMLCFAAKWYGEKRTHFFSEYHDGTDEMVASAWDMVNEADVIIGWNSKNFDLKHLYREFIEAGYYPPSPHKHIDLCAVVKQKFRFTSNKLDFVAGELLDEHKLDTGGMQLWLDCLAGKRAAWNTMRKYNIQDVKVTEDLYEVLKPWITNHPNQNLFIDDASESPVCRNCGGTHLQRRGTYPTSVGMFRRYQCQDCGAWGRGNRNLLKGKADAPDDALHGVS